MQAGIFSTLVQIKENVFFFDQNPASDLNLLASVSFLSKTGLLPLAAN